MYTHTLKWEFNSLRKTQCQPQWSSGCPAPAPDSGLSVLGEEQVGKETAPQPGLLKDSGKTPVEPEAAIHRMRIPLTKCKINLWRRCVLTWSEAQRKRILKWKDSSDAYQDSESLQEKLAVKALRLGVVLRRGSTSSSLICTVLLRSLSRLFASVLLQDSRLKSPLQMLRSIFLINWLSVVNK